MRRLLVKPAKAPAEVPLTASRAMRLSTARAAEQGVGLVLIVSSIAEEVVALDKMVESLEPGLGLIELTRRTDGPPSAIDPPYGVVAVDAEFANAVLEVQTMGRVAPFKPAERALTSADLALTHPFIHHLFEQMVETTALTALDGWVDKVDVGGRFEDARAVGLTLENLSYRIVRISVDLGVADRMGEFRVILPVSESAVAPPPEVDPGTWSQRLENAVMEAPAALRAILHRYQVPLSTADNFHVGQVLPLTGCTVGSVILEGPSGELAARARLGQVAGHIAVRIKEPSPEMLENLHVGGSAGSPAMIETSNWSSDDAMDSVAETDMGLDIDVAVPDPSVSEFEGPMMSDPMPMNIEEAGPEGLPDIDMASPIDPSLFEDDSSSA